MIRRFELALALALAAACSPSQQSLPLAVTPQEVFSRPPDLRGFNIKIWFVERRPETGVYYFELVRRLPLRANGRHPLRLLVLSGAMKLRVGGGEFLLPAGGFASVPPRETYRILNAGSSPLRYAAMFSPDTSWVPTPERPDSSAELE